MSEHEALQRFSPAVRGWFVERFAAPSPPQLAGWPAIAAGQHTLICAPTGSGKTLTAFLWCLDRLLLDLGASRAPRGVHTLYISPLKALNYDIERNLREPLRGIRGAGERLGLSSPAPRVAVRTGDTPAAQRAAMVRQPPHVLITTPESLFILLSSPKAREMLATVRYLIVDEIHALCGNKRGASLALSLERVEALTASPPVRIGLSATVRPLAEAARYLGGQAWSGEELRPRAVTIVDAGRRKELDLQVTAPVADFAALPEGSVWPQVHQQLLELIRTHHTTLIFVRMRAQAERISRALNELAGVELARAHHSALSRVLRRELEEQLKAGRLPALISTGTMELGIDVGAIDLVVQVGSPGSVLAGVQRVGRAGHLLDARSRGRIIPLYREDLVECAVVGRRIAQGEVEQLRVPRNPLDVVAQHIVSAAATGRWTGAELLRLARQAAPYAELTRDALETVLALLAGRYPADVARGLSAKLVWERSSDRVTPLPGARQLAVTAGGTIPDQGHFSLQLPNGTRLGELEEEFVFERRVGDAISFGAGTWRILEIDRQRVLVSPAPGQAAVIPFWKGGLFGRDPELSEAIAAFRGELFARVDDPAAAREWLLRELPVDAAAAANLVSYFAEQRRREREVGTDRTMVVESFKDDLGDHRLVVHACLGNRLNAPWALALRRRLRQRLGVDPQVMSDDNAILVRVSAGEAAPPLDLLELVGPQELEELVLAELAGSPMFGTLFRQNAARFLVLGVKGAGRRTPLWLQRLRAKDLLEATAGLPDFPVRLETYRECLQELMDLPRLRRVLERIRGGEIRVVQRADDGPSPVAAGLLSRFIGQYMYEYDEPRAERTLRHLQLDRNLLEQLLGRGDLAQLLLPEARLELQSQWQGQSEWRRARDPEELLALLLRLGPLPEADLAARCAVDPTPLVQRLLDERRGLRLRLVDPAGASRAWVCAAEDLPLIASAHQPRAVQVEPEGAVASAAGDSAAARQQLLARILDGLGPTTAAELTERSALPLTDVQVAIAELLATGRLVQGQLLSHAEPALCTRTNLEQIRRRSVAIARRQVEPVSPAALQQLVLEQQHLAEGTRLEGPEGLLAAIEALSVRALPAAILERDLLRSRVVDYQPGWLDDRVACGEVLWTGAGAGRLRLLPREDAALLPPADERSAPALAVEALLAARGASFVGDLASSPLSIAELRRGLWQLIWAGRATNDRFEALRQQLATGGAEAVEEPPCNPLTGRPSSFGRRGRRSPAPRAQVGAWTGRWSLLAPRGPGDVVEQLWLLLRRYGVVARELVALEEGVSWAELYPQLRELELLGDVRRGVFVRGLSAAQFAPAEAVDRLRAPIRSGAPLLVNACDPAFIAPAIGVALPAGATLGRRSGSYAVLEAGEVVLGIEGGGAALFCQADAEPVRLRRWLGCLAELIARGQRAVEVARINGQAALRSPLRPRLEELGFRAEGRVLERRRYG